MRHVGQQAIGDIDSATGQPAQAHACRQAGLGAIEASALFRIGLGAGQDVLQGQGRVAKGAADPQTVTAGGVAADQGDVPASGQFEQPFAEGVQPGFVGLGQGQCQGKPGRLGAHGGQITEIHGQRLPADVEGPRLLGKVHPADQGRKKRSMSSNSESDINRGWRALPPRAGRRQGDP